MVPEPHKAPKIPLLQSWIPKPALPRSGSGGGQRRDEDRTGGNRHGQLPGPLVLPHARIRARRNAARGGGAGWSLLGLAKAIRKPQEVD